MAVIPKPVSAARAASMAAASKRYRARKTAEKYGVAIPSAVAARRLPMYRPPKAVPGASPAMVKHLQKVAAYNSRQEAAGRASSKAAAQREALAQGLRKIPQANNPLGKIFMPAPIDRRVGPSGEAKVILGRAAAAKLQAAGKRLKDEFTKGDYAPVGKLSADERARFRDALDRISKASPQTLAIYFHHEGGSSEFGSVIAGLSVSTPDASSASDALDRLDVIAERVENAESVYGTAAVGKLDL